MRFFIDTARAEEIRKAKDVGAVCGASVNPALIAGEGRALQEMVAGIASVLDGPISCEVDAAAADAEGMIAEGRAIAAIHPHMVVKLPLTAEGLKACRALADEGISVNMAMMFSANQALLAARAGAAYVSPFSGRLHDISQRGVDLIREVADIFSVCDVDTQIIATNVCDLARIADCEQAGADIATVPYAVIEQMTGQPQTDAAAGE